MNNNTNPNKRRASFNTQQRRGAKRQKLNPQNIATRGRGRVPRGRGRIQRGRGYFRGRGHGNINLNRTINITPPNTISTPSLDEAALRAKLLANQNKNKSSISSQKPLISGAMTSTQIENEQRAKLLAQKRQNLQKTLSAAHKQTDEERRRLLRLKALKSMSQKNKTNQIETEAVSINQRRRNVLINKKSLSPQKGSNLNPNPVKTNTNIITPNVIQHIMRRNLKSYRKGPKSKDNISFTTTIFDSNNNVVKTVISTNNNNKTQKASKKSVYNASTKNKPKETDTKRMNIPPKIISSETVAQKQLETVAQKQSETKKNVINKIESLPKESKNWACNHCTFHNIDNESMMCLMCQKMNTIKKPIPSECDKAIKEDKVSIDTVWKQREEAIKEREIKDVKVSTVSITKPVLHSELQRKKVIEKRPLPSLLECWRLDVKEKINDKELDVFIVSTDALINRMNNDLKRECKAVSVEYMNPFDVENDYIVFDVLEDFEWTKNVCKEKNISWPDNFDINAFSTAVTQCNDY